MSGNQQRELLVLGLSMRPALVEKEVSTRNGCRDGCNGHKKQAVMHFEGLAFC